MRIPVAEQRQPGCDIDLVFLQVEGVDAYYRTPQAWYHATCEDDWEGPGDAC